MRNIGWKYLVWTAWLGLGVCGAIAAEPWTLERAMEQALANNPDARLARERIAIAQAGLQQADAAFWPRLQLQSSYTRTDNPMLVFGSVLNQRAYRQSLDFNDVPDADDLNVKGLVTLPLYEGGRLRAQRGAARANTAASRQDDIAVRNQLAFEVARAFYTAQKAREFIRSAEAAVAAYQTNITIAERRLKAGTLLKTDTLDLEVRLAQAREDQVRARNGLALAERALRNLAGLEEGDFVVSEVSPELRVPETRDYSERAEIAAARDREQAASEQVRGARSGYQPRVSAFGSLDYDYGWKFDNGGKSYTAGAMLQWDIWDGKLTRGRVNEARARLNAAREEERKVRLAVSLEVEEARLGLDAANERLVVAEQAVKVATESATLTRARFEQGETLSTQLMDAETALIAARVRRAEAQADRRIAIAALRKALGLPQLDSMPTRSSVPQ